MLRTFLVLALLAPTLALAQASFPTVFPADAVPFEPEALKQRLAGKVFIMKPAAGAEIRLQYQDTNAYFNVGGASDSGKWRVDGSSVCVDWRRIAPGCSEMRRVGDTIYTKRASNGEVVVLQPQ